MMSTFDVPAPESRDVLHDEFLGRQVLQSLTDSGYAELRQVGCRVDDGVVALHGRVPSFFLKQVAQTLALRHGRGVDNRVDVA